MEPADDQATTLPLGSVIVTKVLLKEHFIWTTPLRGAFLPFLGPAAGAVFSSFASIFASAFSATLYLLVLLTLLRGTIQFNVTLPFYGHFPLFFSGPSGSA